MASFMERRTFIKLLLGGAAVAPIVASRGAQGPTGPTGAPGRDGTVPNFKVIEVHTKCEKFKLLCLDEKPS